jgi:RNA polymerase sigma factor (sigma-70 family)
MASRADEMAFVTRLCACDEAAWRAFLDEYRHGLRCVAVQLNSHADFEDLLGSFLVKLLGGVTRPGILRQYDGRAKLCTFLSISFRHHVIDHQRAARPCEPLLSDPPDDHALDPVASTCAQEEERLLSRALTHLDARARQLIDLHYYQGHSVRVLAELLGCSKSKIARELACALSRLQHLTKTDGTACRP